MISRDIDLFGLNTFGLHSRAAFFAEIADLVTLRNILSHTEFDELPKLVLGGGSNIIFENDFPGLILKSAIRSKIVIRETADTRIVEAGAGERWHDFVCWTLEQGWGGLENLALIPGSVGAAPVQNIGAYGMEVSDCIEAVKAFHFETKSVITFKPDECAFGYRDSIFKCQNGEWFILNVQFRLPKIWNPNLSYPALAEDLKEKKPASLSPRQIAESVIRIRKKKLPDPAEKGNVGSFFKNPIIPSALFQQLLIRFPEIPHFVQPQGFVKIPAGWFIEQIGWKGKASGPVGCHQQQALVLVNHGGATGKDVRHTAEIIRNEVERVFCLKLEYEPMFI